MNFSIKLACILNLVIGITGVTIQSVIAQSSDRSRPTPLTLLRVTGGGSGRTYFYSFIASPGELSVFMRNSCGSALGFGASAVFEEENGTPLLDISPGAAYPDRPQQATRNKSFSQSTPVILSVTHFGSEASGCSYQIDLSGTSARQITNSSAAPVATIDLSGQWQGNDGGIYYIRQVGNRVWWSGESANNGGDWSNVFQGTVAGTRLTGNWADVPKGTSRQSGSLNLQLNSANRLSIVSQTGGFSGTEWTRR